MLIILLDIFSHHYRIYIKYIYIGSLDFFNSLESILFYLSSVISDTPEFYFFYPQNGDNSNYFLEFL